jgi:hypothetical protein
MSLRGSATSWGVTCPTSAALASHWHGMLAKLVWNQLDLQVRILTPDCMFRTVHTTWCCGKSMNDRCSA